MRERLPRKTVEAMLLSRNKALEDGRRYYSIGCIMATSKWRPISVAGVEVDQLAAVQALIREAQEYDADAIVDLDFQVDGVMRDDIDGAPLQRVAAKGIAVRFSQAAWSPIPKDQAVATLDAAPRPTNLLAEPRGVRGLHRRATGEASRANWYYQKRVETE